MYVQKEAPKRARKSVGAETISFVMVREPDPRITVSQVRGPADVYRMATERGMLQEGQEVFLAIMLTTRHTISGVTEVTRGILDASLIHPREVFRAAVMSNAAGIILVHNHPSGDPTPSPEDHAVTRQLCEAGRALGIPVMDHVVVARDGWRTAMDFSA